MNKTMTYVPSRLTSAETDKVIAGANEILDDDINLKQNVINTLNKRVIDIDSAPTSSTLTYIVNGVTCNFKVGDEVRVADQESETGYTFYKLYALTTEESVTTATWDEFGAGGSAPVNLKETVKISLTQIGGNAADLIGASVVITNTDTSSVLLNTTWQGSTIQTNIAVGVNYTVTVGSVSGYGCVLSKSFRADSFLKDVNFYYGAYGVYIEATDGSLYTYSTWSSAGKIANSIALLTGTKNIRISIDSQSTDSVNFDVDNQTVRYCLPVLSTEQALADLDGRGNTNTLFAYADSYKASYKYRTNTALVWGYCNTYVFPNGQTGYVAALGELQLIYNNITAVTNCLGVFGKTLDKQIRSSAFAGSDGGNYERMLKLNFSDGSVVNDNPAYSWASAGYALPITEFQ